MALVVLTGAVVAVSEQVSAQLGAPERHCKSTSSGGDGGGTCISKDTESGRDYAEHPKECGPRQGDFKCSGSQTSYGAFHPNK
jgi:hypothetical protein